MNLNTATDRFDMAVMLQEFETAIENRARARAALDRNHTRAAFNTYEAARSRVAAVRADILRATPA